MEAPPDWEARHLLRGKAVLEWMGDAPASERSAVEGYFVETSEVGSPTSGVDAPPEARTWPECLPDPDCVYDEPKPPTWRDDWSSTLDGLVDRVEKLRELAVEQQRRATEKLTSIRAGLSSGWSFAESFAARIHLSAWREPRRRAAPLAGKKHSKH